jgi:hypothetical protein
VRPTAFAARFIASIVASSGGTDSSARTYTRANTGPNHVAEGGQRPSSANALAHRKQRPRCDAPDT